MLFKRQKFDWLLVALLALGLFLYCSYQPRFRLSPAMPADFVDEPTPRSYRGPDPETKIAGAYWSCMVNNVQWEYGYGHTLPADPPATFTGPEASGITGENNLTRMRYWRRAQHVWYLPTAWQKEYEWNFDWTTNWFQNGVDAMRHMLERLGN